MEGDRGGRCFSTIRCEISRHGSPIFRFSPCHNSHVLSWPFQDSELMGNNASLETSIVMFYSTGLLPFSCRNSLSRVCRRRQTSFCRLPGFCCCPCICIMRLLVGFLRVAPLSMFQRGNISHPGRVSRHISVGNASHRDATMEDTRAARII